MVAMKRVFLFFVLALSTLYGYEASELSLFNTPMPTKEAAKKKECWVICKKRLTEIEKIEKALEYYKSSRYYSFSSSFDKKRSR